METRGFEIFSRPATWSLDDIVPRAPVSADDPRVETTRGRAGALETTETVFRACAGAEAACEA